MLFFKEGDEILGLQHRLGARWDRYATMLDRHWAVQEAMNGHSPHAAFLAARGIYRAIRADSENQPAVEHKAFVRKHARANAAAGALALTKAVSVIPAIQSWRFRSAGRLSG